MFVHPEPMEVFNPAIMPEVDCNSNPLNAELEVRKLQELVRKLERQNEQLRTRALPPSPPYVPAVGTGGLRLPSPLPELLDYFEAHKVEEGADAEEDEQVVLDDLELLDLDSVCSSDASQETWLYMTQRFLEGSEDSLTPLQWCRRVLDSPKSDLETSRRSLSLRLEQGRSLQRSVFSPQSSANDEDFSLGFKLQDLTDVQVMARMQEDSLRQDLALPLPPRRSHSLTSFPRSSLSGPTSGLEEEEEELEDDDDCGFPLPPPQPRLTRLPHSHTFSNFTDWPRGGSSTGLCTPPSTPSTPQHLSAGFTFSTPPHSLELAQGSPSAESAFRAGSDKLRRSLPNLVRAPSMPCVPSPPSTSPCLLRSSHSFDLSSGLTRLHSSIPSPGPLQSRVHSVGSFSSMSRPPLKATAYVSPTIKSPSYLPPSSSPYALSPLTHSVSSSGIPLLSKHSGGSPTPPRSGLPRPASFIATSGSTPRSKLAQSGRSFLTPPKSLSALSALRDSSAWRDGCY